MKPRSLLILLIVIYFGCFIYLLNRSLNLNFNGQLTALLPSKNNHLASYEKLKHLNSSEGVFNLIIHTQNGKNIVSIAKQVTERLLALELDGEKIFRSAELENDLYDIKYSALYLMTKDELNTLYTDIERYIRDKKMEENPFYVDLEASTAQLDVHDNTSVLLERVSGTERFSVNEDSTIISVRFLPGFPRGNFDKLESAYTLLLEKTGEIESEIGNIQMYWGGAYVDHYHKISDIEYSVIKTSVIGTFTLILFLVVYMLLINRNWEYRPFYILIDLGLIFFILFSGFAISLGISTFLFDEINIFTGIIFSILFGINLDYILHLHFENRKRFFRGSSIRSLVGSYFSSTKPVLLSCLTTGLAIASLIFADFDGFVQFGIVFFIIITVTLLSTYLFLILSPSFGKQKETSEQENNKQLQWPWLAETKRPQRVLGLSVLMLAMGVGTILGARALSFNFNFSDLEPRSVPTNFDRLASELSSGSDYHEPVYFITNSIEASRALFFYIRDNLGTKYKDIERVESFSARYPVTKEEREAKTIKIDSLKQLIHANESYLTNVSDQASEFIRIVQNTVPPTIENLPKYIKNRFFLKNGSIAPLVIVYPEMSLSNGETSIQFRKSSGVIELESGKKFYAASTSIIASSILELLIRESTFLFMTPLLTILLLFLIYYQSLKKALIAVAPLILTFGFLLSIRAFFEFDINLYNVIIFPIIIGVEADNGIHIVDALNKRKEDFLNYFFFRKFPVLAACSVATMLGFIGLLFINHPGMESIGILAVMGTIGTIIATFLTLILVQTFLLKR